VERGDLIARVGTTGRSVAPHLHYEVLIDGIQVNPEDYIIREGSTAAIF
jgi:murein DD-endopeptidase MepM/ murein hydrolase activator NlpD